jgi:hypothetical protein
MIIKSSLFCIFSLILVHILAFFIGQNSQPYLDAAFLIKEISYSGIILILGSLMMYVKFQKEQFVSRFMIITVFQMLAILAFVAALVYLKVKPLRTHALLFVFTYLAGMVVQTGFFLHFSKETSK